MLEFAEDMLLQRVSVSLAVHVQSALFPFWSHSSSEQMLQGAFVLLLKSIIHISSSGTVN